MRLSVRAGIASLVALGSIHCQAETFAPPTASADVFQGMALDGTPVGDNYKAAFAECDKTHSGEGMYDTQCGTPGSAKPGPDPNNNTALLKLASGALLFDAKMSVDANGSAYALKHVVAPEVATTALTYADGKSLDAEKVRYIALPGPSRKNPTVTFAKETGAGLGDVAAVIYDGKITYAIVGDTSRFHRIGDASMAVHDALGHAACSKKASNGACAQPARASVPKEVVYLVFPGTRAELCGATTASPVPSARLCDAVTAANINDRIDAVGSAAFKKLNPAAPAASLNFPALASN